MKYIVLLFTLLCLLVVSTAAMTLLPSGSFIYLDETTRHKTYTVTETYIVTDSVNFYDAAGPSGNLPAHYDTTSDGEISFYSGSLTNTWQLTFNDFSFPRSAGDFNHFGQLSMSVSDDGLIYEPVAISWFTDTGYDRRYPSGMDMDWPTPGDVVPAYWMYALFSYGAPSDYKINIDSPYIRFRYINNVDGTNYYALPSGWDINMQVIPEPSSYAQLLGGLALGLVALRRR